jgi:inorganic pyrophosphatase
LLKKNHPKSDLSNDCECDQICHDLREVRHSWIHLNLVLAGDHLLLLFDMKDFSPWRPHPWHGISVGRKPPEYVNSYIEITPSDGIKYEIDKDTGYLKVDRPQLTSSLPPALYGFIPKTYCGDRVARLSPQAKMGDGDPLDICVLSERPITRPEVLVPSRVIGGFRMIDRGEADDKIIAVLESDPYWTSLNDIKDLSPVLRQRLEHYFLTYKLLPGEVAKTQIDAVYGNEEAQRVILAAIDDYDENYPPA